jgi:GTP cyclohydrolase II
MTNIIKHDEYCDGFDVLGSDICMCRPHLRHGIEECAQENGQCQRCGKKLSELSSRR